MTILEGVVPYPSEFAARYRAKGYWEDHTIAAFFDEIASRYADRVAFVTGNKLVTASTTSACHTGCQSGPIRGHNIFLYRNPVQKNVMTPKQPWGFERG